MNKQRVIVIIETKYYILKKLHHAVSTVNMFVE